VVGRLKIAVVGTLALLGLVSIPAIGAVQGSGASPAVSQSARSQRQGAAFAMTNVISGNRIVAYRRAANGSLTRVGSVATRGNGIGTDLDTQGSLRLSSDHRYLYAANAGSDDVTVFSVNGANLKFLQRINAGDEPNSLALHGDLLYVLDGSVAGNGIRGFRVGSNGRLTALPRSFRMLSSPIAVPGDLEFSPDGRVLLVTHKTTNTTLTPANAIDAFTVGSNGLAAARPVRNPSTGLRPFSVAFSHGGRLVVAESFNASAGRSALSAYRLAADGKLSVTDRSVPNHQTDTCWVVVTKDGRYAFTANFGSGTISSYRLDARGEVSLIAGKAALLGATSQPVDLALSANSQYLYLLLRGKGAVAAFRIQENGALQSLGTTTGALPVADGASGLAAY